MKRAETIVATTHRIPAYGGFQLERQTLEEMAQTLNSQSVPMRMFHDPRVPLRVANVDASVRQRPDGEYELRVDFDVDETDWARFEAERSDRGGPGGMSFTITEPLGKRQRQGEAAPISVVVAADAHHFTDGQILAAANEFVGADSVEARRLYQFSAAPAALALIQFFLQGGAQVPPGMISAWLYDALRHFRRGAHQSPGVTLELKEGANGREVRAVIPVGTDSPVAERAIAAFESVANQPGTYECTPDGGWRVVRE
jgi:hypothetical protein